MALCSLDRQVHHSHGSLMPAKKQHITDEERAKRIRETAREFGTSNSPEDFERAFKRVIASKPQKQKN